MQNESPMTLSQVERELEKIWPTMVFYEDLLVKKPDVIYDEYHDGPSFLLGLSQEFNTPTPSPDGLASEDAEVLDIPSIREILPEDIVLHAEQDPSTIRSLKPLTLEQENKIYRWVINGSKSNELQEEKIASWSEDHNFLLRGEFRFLRPNGWIDDKNITITDNNLDAYHKHGTYVGIHPNLGTDGKHFGRDKAKNRKWWLLLVYNRLQWYLYAFNLEKKELLVLDSMHDHPLDDLRRSLDTYVGRIIEDMLKIVIPTFDHKGVGFPSRYAKVPKQPNNDDRGIYVIKFMEEWTPDSILTAYTNISIPS
ncbi:hypothetical protein PIB30_061076 [Stylosanthes scabra]|uniref:Ubiquitin-like protease family profile domain-containing protein n=1 Tax=Stylosanthes scabra TaxID=79078 RepID=A0ABU6ZJE5_9FABA|nr:hypothetical protein [Stylosanthes scabra]